MAQIIGESGAYSEIRRKLSEVGLEIARLEDVARLRDELPRLRESGEAGALAEYEATRRQLAERLAEWEPYVAGLLAAGLPPLEANANAALDAMKAAEGERDAVGSFLSNLLRPLRLPRWFAARGRLAEAREAFSRAGWELERFRKTTEAPLRQCHEALAYHDSHRAEFLRDRLQRVDGQIALVNRLLEHEVGGAAAELEVMELLAGLPEGWIVLHNVELEADRWIYQNGRNIRTAQLDHVAIGLGGVFVIETKNWSREFIAKGEYHSPFEQVGRGSDLCYRLLKENGHACRVRAVIATRSKLGDQPEDSFAKVKRPEELCGYLTWFKPELTAGEVVSVAALLRSMGQPRHTSQHF